MSLAAPPRSLSAGERSLLALLRTEGQLPDAASPGEETLAAARSHGLTPALYHRLAACPDALPPALWDALRNDYWQTAAYNTLLYRELGRVLAAFADLPVLVLKGAALAEAVYGNVALRPMGDMDLLVPKARLREAIRLAEGLGYQAQGREHHPGFGEEYENEVMLANAATDAMLELHWHILDAPFYIQSIPEEALWQQAVPARIAGQPSATFTPEATLIYLAAHWVLHHRSHRLLWLYDLDRLIRHRGAALSWEKAFALAKAWHLTLPTRIALEQCVAHLDTPLPSDARTSLAGLSPTPQEQRIFAHLTSPQQDAISRFWVDLTTIQGLRRKLRFLWYNVFPSRSYMIQRYAIPAGHALWPYYLRRLGAGLRRAIRW